MAKIVQNDSEIRSGNHKCGFAAIIGMPNAGKSTLMNRYLKEKISIVTPKPQTTRNNVTSILSSENFQTIFIDTPGILKPRYKMQKVMASFVRNAVKEADVILLLIDAAEFRDNHHPAIVSFADKLKKKQVIVALNKIDLVKKSYLLPIIQKTTEIFSDSEIIPISALGGDGTDDLFDVILEKLPEGPKLYPDDIISSEPERFFVSELIREAIFLTMEQEIPYSSAVVIEQYNEKETIVVIHAVILVEKKSQKPIIIGRNGATIKKIGIQARLGIEEFLGRKVFLELRVKVRKDWRKKDVFLREAGLLKR
ncbi:GTPase Era [Candidatus Latescibacterota bacterium]